VSSSFCGAAVCFRCACECAVRGLRNAGTDCVYEVSGHHAIASVSAQADVSRVALAILGEAAIFRSLHLALYAGMMLLIAHVFVLTNEEPTLARQVGESYEECRRRVPRWIRRPGGNV
jgi:hypothetical protein